MANKRYDIHNPTQTPRVIYDAKSQAVSIPPGQTTPNVELTDFDVREMQERTAKDPKSDLTLEASKGAITKTFITEEIKKVSDEGGDGAGGADVGSVRKEQAQTLIDKADSTEFNPWRAEVKEFLGDDFPSGKPRKKQLVAKLKKVK